MVLGSFAVQFGDQLRWGIICGLVIMLMITNSCFFIRMLFFWFYSGTRVLLSASYILGSLNGKYLFQLISYLVPVLQSSPRSRFVSCWHAKTDGWAVSTFHRQCDGKGPILSPSLKSTITSLVDTLTCLGLVQVSIIR